MSFLFSITPADAKPNNKRKGRKSDESVFTYLLVGLWYVLIMFGVLSVINPPWLENISSPGREVEAYSAKQYGDLFLRGGEYNKAVAMYLGALEIKPGFIDAIVNLAITYGKMGLNDKAIETLEESLELDPEQPSIVYYNIAEIYEQSGKPKEALENYYKAAETARLPMFPYRKIGSLHIAHEEFDLAIEAFKLALENKYTLKNSYLGMLKTAKYAANNDTIVGAAAAALLEKGITEEDLAPYDNVVFEEGLRYNKDISRIYNDMGFAYAVNGKVMEAIPHFESALKIWPGNTNAQNNLNAAMERISNG